MQPWQQQPNEPDLWFARFHEFLLSGSGRSLLATYNASAKKPEKARTIPSSWREAAKKWNWESRAIAFDNHQQSEDLEVWQRRRREIREKQWAIAEKLLNKAQEMLEVPLSDQRWTAIAPARFAQTAIDLARQAAELGDFEFNEAARIVTKYGFQIRDRFKHELSDRDIGWLEESQIEDVLDKY